MVSKSVQAIRGKYVSPPALSKEYMDKLVSNALKDISDIALKFR